MIDDSESRHRRLGQPKLETQIGPFEDKARTRDYVRVGPNQYVRVLAVQECACGGAISSEGRDEADAVDHLNSAWIYHLKHMFPDPAP
jgi:hypothetical protein